MPRQSFRQLERLRDELATQPQLTTLWQYLKPGKNPPRRLAKDAVLVTLHLKWMEFPPYGLTDIGIATFDRRQLNGGLDAPEGPHAEELLKHVWFMHLRIMSRAHLPSSDGDPTKFHFGSTAYVSPEQALDMLHQIWNQPMPDQNPNLGLRPIICLTFGDNHGLIRVRKEFDFDPATMSTNIAVLDGQVIATQAKITRNTCAPLNYLLGQFHITPHDHMNSGNAAAYITMVAILSTLRTQLYESLDNPRAKVGQHGQSSSKPAQQVVHWLMEHPTPPPPFGTEVFCCRCGSFTHFFAECHEPDSVCTKCLQSNLIWRRENAVTHKEGLCIFRF